HRRACGRMSPRRGDAASPHPSRAASRVSAPAPTQGWVGAVAMAVASQTAVALLTRVVPTLAPVLMASLAVGPSFIGYLATLSSFGSILFYLGGMPLIRRVGSIRTLQIGIAVAALGTAFLVSSSPLVLMIGS